MNNNSETDRELSGKRIAIVASGIYSPLSTVAEFARRAQVLGCDVKVFAPASAKELLSFCGLSHQVIPRPKIHTSTPLLQDKDPCGRADRLKRAVSAFGVGDLAQKLSQYEPDAVFVDCEMHAHILVAVSLGQPVVQYSNMFLSPPGLRAPPLHKRVFPGQDLQGSRLWVFLTWVHYLMRKRAKIRRFRNTDCGADHASALEELAGTLGVPIRKLRRIVSWQMPWTYRLPTVLFLPQLLDLPTKPYDKMTYLGPMVLEHRPDKNVRSEGLARYCSSSENRRRILVAFGSMMPPDSQLLTNIWAIADSHPDWLFLCAAGKHWDRNTLRGLPDNVTVTPWVPQREVLKYTDLAIMHGGTGGLAEAVEAATPVLIYPHVNDQKGSAARAVFHGIGRAGRVTDPIKKMEMDIAFLLDNQAVASACDRMRDACFTPNNYDALASYLRELFGHTPAATD